MDTNQKVTSIEDIGEFALINRLVKKFTKKNKSTIKDYGDDAALIDFKNKQMVISTDMLVEGIHFDRSYTPLKHLGYKAVIINLSDIYAMNAKPTQIVISLSVSSTYSVEALEELYEGIRLACGKHQVDLVGGDTTSSRYGMTISITAIGEVEKENVTYRNGAKENDLICVSGDLGAAYMGLQVLLREKEVFKTNPNVQPQLEGYDYILQRQLKPEARKDIIDLLQKTNIKPTAMIDVSDGLSSEILHICEQSNVGCMIYEEKIPLAKETREIGREFNLAPSIPALNGGEDYELLFTIPLKYTKDIQRYPEITIIGHITKKEKGKYLVSNDEKLFPLEAQGWKMTDS